jgi:hypothetical protein
MLVKGLIFHFDQADVRFLGEKKLVTDLNQNMNDNKNPQMDSYFSYH